MSRRKESLVKLLLAYLANVHLLAKVRNTLVGVGPSACPSEYLAYVLSLRA